MDVVTRKQLNMLIQVAEADKHFAKAERELIFKIARERNFPEDQVEELIQNPEPIGSLGALTQNQKFEYLYTSIELISIDKNIFPSEIIFCKSIAIKLGFKKSVTEFLIENLHTKTKEELSQVVLTDYL